MNEYVYTDKVRAVKIKEIKTGVGVFGFGKLIPEDDGMCPFNVSNEFMEYFNPAEGGYYVVGSDNRPRFLSAKGFEPNSTKVT
jgi:hypothetical protein